MNQQQIDRVLSLLLMAEVKRNDAPCASQTSWSEAIVILAKYASEGAITDIECLHELNAAQEIIGALTGGDRILQIWGTGTPSAPICRLKNCSGLF